MVLCVLVRFGRVLKVNQRAARLHPLWRFCWVLIDLAAGTLMVTTLMGFFGRYWWFLDWFSHFRVQFFFLSCVLCLIYFIGKHRWMTAVMGVFLLLNFSLIFPLYIFPPHVQSEGQVYRILLANVFTENPNHGALSNLIAESDPDFVMLIEVNQTWLGDLNLTGLGYAHVISDPREDNFGIALFSRYPFESSEIKPFGHFDLPSIVAQVTLDHQPVIIVLSHPVPPKSEGLTLHRNSHIHDLMTFVAEQDEIIMAAGDFNATSWSPFFKDWLQIAHLRDSRLGFGVQPTWPARSWWLRVPIDHILVSPEITVHFRAVGPDIGSDHFPVIMDFSLVEKN